MSHTIYEPAVSAGKSVKELDNLDTFRLDTCDSEASGMSESRGIATK